MVVNQYQWEKLEKMILHFDLYKNVSEQIDNFVTLATGEYVEIFVLDLPFGVA